MKFCAAALAFALMQGGSALHRRAPVDVQTMNRFVVQFNRYTGGLETGITDVKQWDRVEAAWKDLK